MISTSFISGGGFMKCMPMTRSGRVTAAPIIVMLIDDVFVASTMPLRQTRSSVCEDLSLGGDVFGGRLDDEVDRLQIAAVKVGRRNARDDRGPVGGGHLPLLDQPIQLLADRGNARALRCRGRCRPA